MTFIVGLILDVHTMYFDVFRKKNRSAPETKSLTRIVN